MTDDPAVKPLENEFYLILDVPVEISRARLEQSGKDLTEKYHTVSDLTHYRRRFLEVAALLGEALCTVIDASGSPEQVLELSLHAIRQREQAHLSSTEGDGLKPFA